MGRLPSLTYKVGNDIVHTFRVEVSVVLLLNLRSCSFRTCARPVDPPMPTRYRTQSSRFGAWVGREELFERKRGGDPHFRGWDECVKSSRIKLLLVAGYADTYHSALEKPLRLTSDR